MSKIPPPGRKMTPGEARAHVFERFGGALHLLALHEAREQALADRRAAQKKVDAATSLLVMGLLKEAGLSIDEGAERAGIDPDRIQRGIETSEPFSEDEFDRIEASVVRVER
jgi:hypothetical protein